jgi:hypothetical protein
MKTNTQFFFIPLAFLFVGTAQAAVAPTIKAVSVTPTTAPAGTKFKFSATLNEPLAAGNKVKIDLGKGLMAMAGTKTSYSLIRAIFTTGSQTYNVGIYNAKNALQGKVNAGTYTVTSASPVNHAPTLTLVSSDTTATANVTYTVTLNPKDVDANLGSITMNWGDSTAPDTLTATDSKDLVFSHTYAAEGDFSWNAFASDKGMPVLKSKSVSKIVTVSNPVPVEVIDVPVQNNSGDKKNSVVYLDCVPDDATPKFSLKLDETSGKITATRPGLSQNADGFFSPTEISFQIPFFDYGYDYYKIDRRTLGFIFGMVLGGKTEPETTGECFVINTSGNKI